MARYDSRSVTRFANHAIKPAVRPTGLLQIFTIEVMEELGLNCPPCTGPSYIGGVEYWYKTERRGHARV